MYIGKRNGIPLAIYSGKRVVDLLGHVYYNCYSKACLTVMLKGVLTASNKNIQFVFYRETFKYKRFIESINKLKEFHTYIETVFRVRNQLADSL